MKIREIAIDKLQKLPNSLLRQVSDFIDFLTYKHQAQPNINAVQNTFAETWAGWVESVDQFKVGPNESVGDYQKHLPSKYRKQGLELWSSAMQGFFSVFLIGLNPCIKPTEA